MKRFIALLLIFSFWVSPVIALTVDDSIDSEIRKTYKTDVVEQVLLPKLPQTGASPLDGGTAVSTPQETIFSQNYKEPVKQPAQQSRPITTTNTVSKKTATTPTSSSFTQNSYSLPNYTANTREISIKKGTKFRVRCQNTLSDRTPRGTRLTFVSVYPESSTYITIPAGTVFYGTVVDSHPPQLSGNGGLISLKVDNMMYRGKSQFVLANVSVANYKYIFFSNVKGKRKYIRNMGKFIKPGSTFMKRMWRVCGSLSNGPEILLTPLPIACGVVVYAVNVALSPVLSIFSMGESVTLPKGTYFEIKLAEDAVVRY
ncbi:MAG: hypothetical protein PHV37_02110 [Candidatus Gastranaerophilales bacterium]|nr:hypothetical protein [Candidatus Gastranaerophilales bacterium]